MLAYLLSVLAGSRDRKRMLSQSDNAYWLRAHLLYDKDGNLTGIDRAQLADMLDPKGRHLNKRNGDAEGLAALTPAGPKGPVLVSFEEHGKIWRYDLSKSLDVKPEPIRVPLAIDRLRGNSGLEGLTMLKPGKILAVMESARDRRDDMRAWVISYPNAASAVRYKSLSVIPHPPYQISDAAMGPGGHHLYLLERHYFGLIGGVVIAVREIDTSDVKEGARLGGTEIAKFTMRETIDNMEGLSLRRGNDGKTYLYMISDDNYNRALQRTLLLMFELAPAQYPPKPESGGTTRRKSQ